VGVKRGSGGVSIRRSTRGHATELARIGSTARPSAATDWMPRRPILALAAAASGFAVGTGIVAAAHGFDDSVQVARAPVPNVIGQSAPKAAAMLASKGFAAAIRRQTGPKGTGGRVLAQSPSPGESEAVRSTVVLTIAGRSRAPLSAPVPSVVGLSVRQAIGRLERMFRTTLVRTADTSTSGQVLTQTPRAGAIALIGSVVSLAVASRAHVPQVTVPALAGLAVEDAIARVKAVGLAANPVRESSETVASGIVIDSIPEAGASAAEGAMVTLRVSDGSRAGRSVAIPSLVDLTAEDATATLKAIGLSAVLVREPSETVASGVVISSTPVTGTSAERGATVTLTVSTGPAPVE